MKKQRPAYILCTLCRREERQKFEQLIFRHTSTIGIRSVVYDRSALARGEKELQTPLGAVRVKEAADFGVKKIKIEYEDVLRIAREKDMPFTAAYEMILKELDR